MRQIDKTTLTYRPVIDYDIVLSQSIKDKIHVVEEDVRQKFTQNSEDVTTHKTELLKEYEKYNPTIVIPKLVKLEELKDKLVDKLETVNVIDKHLNKGFGYDNYEHSITDPVIHDTSVAMKHIVNEISGITNLIKELFDFVDVTDVDLSNRLDTEYTKLHDAIAKEQAQITFYNKYQLSDIERSYVDKLIADRSSGIRTYQDYINRIIEEYRTRGADGIDYEELRSNTKKSYVAQHMLDETISLGEKAIEIHDYNMSDLFNDRVDDTLEYLVDYASRSDVKDMTELNYRKTIRDVNVIAENMARYNNDEFREALNKHIMELEKVRRRYAYTGEKEAVEHLEPSIRLTDLSNSTKSLVESNWENALVDRVGSTNALVHQLSLLLGSAMEQKEYSLMYRFADIIDREFDFEHKDKEMQNFNSRNGIYSMQ